MIPRLPWLDQLSEDVDATLAEGIFGGADETGKLLNRAAAEGARGWTRTRRSDGRALLELSPKNATHSILCAAYSAHLPVTVHLTLGGDISHFHPEANGAALGETYSYRFPVTC